MAFSGRQYFELFSGFLVSGPDDRGEYQAYCPAHENPATSKSPSGSIQFRNTDVDRRGGIWHCYVCNPTGRDTGLNSLRVKLENRKRDGFSLPPASAFIVPKFLTQNAGTGEGKSRTVRRNGNVFFLPDLSEEQESEPVVQKSTKKKKNPPSADTIDVWVENLFDNDYPERLQFWIDRGVSPEILEQFRIGWQSATGRYTMPVCDEEGNCFDVRRYKSSDHKNKFTWYIGGSQYLYGLDQWPDSDEYVLLEGEPDTLLGRTLDLPAVCNTGGAGTWHDEWSSRFAGKTVFIAYDNDKAGRENRGKVAASLLRAGAKVFLIDIPRDSEEWEDENKGPDFTDFYRSCRGKKRFLRKWRALTDAAKPYEEEGQETERNLEVFNAYDYNLTDDGVALRFARHHSDSVVYVADRKQWRYWNGKFWAEDIEGIFAQNKILETIKNMAAEAKFIDDEKSQAAYIKTVRNYENMGKRNSVRQSAEMTMAVIKLAAEFDTDKMLINCQNGILDLKTGELSEHDPKRFMTKITGSDYNPEAECPAWMEFMETILPDQGSRRYLQKAIGYSLTGDTSEQKIFLLHGSGANGKSTFIETLRHVIGGYGIPMAPNTLVKKQGGNSATPELARLEGYRFTTAPEFSSTRAIDEELLRQLSGGEPVTSRHLYAGYRDYEAQMKIWISANTLPRIEESSEGTWRRLVTVRFPLHIEEEDQDKRLPQKLNKEHDGIFMWAIKGCMLWLKEGLAPTAAMKSEMQQYRESQDVIGSFLQECCDIHPDARISSDDLWQRFERYVEQMGDDKGWSKIHFSRRLKARKENFDVQPRKIKTEKGNRISTKIWFGLTLKEGEKMGFMKAVR